MTVTDRLVAVREMLQMTQKQISAHYGLGSSTWQRWEQAGEPPNSGVLQQIYRDGFDLHWLLTGEGEMLARHAEIQKPSQENTQLAEPSSRDFLLSELGKMGYVHLPYFGVDATAGGGSLVEIEQPIRRVGFQREWLNREIGVNPANLILMNSRGDSALPLIRDGDLLMLDISTPKLRSGKSIYAFVHEGLLYIKYLERRLDGGLIVTSENSELYKPEELTPEQVRDLNIIGRVVWNAGKV